MNRSTNRSAGVVALCAGLGMALSSGAARGAQVTAQWLNPVSGNWADAAMWSTAPQFPNNWNPGGTTYRAVIDAVGAAYTVSLSQSVALDQLTLHSADATLQFAAGQLVLGAGSSVKAGRLQLAGGFLFNEGDMAFDGTLEWFGGEIVGAYGTTLTLGVDAVASLIGGAGAMSLQQDVMNFGTMHMQAASMHLAADVVNHGEVVATGGQVYGSGPTAGSFVNMGTYVKQGLGAQSFRALDNEAGFYNAGLARVEEGQFVLDSDGGHSGVFEILAGAELQFKRMQTLTATSALTGAGRLFLNNCDFAHSGATTLTGAAEIASSDAAFLSDASFGDLTIRSSMASFQGELMTPRLRVESSTVSLSQDLSTDRLEWQSAHMTGGVEVRVASGGTATVDGTTNTTYTVGVHLVNEGVMSVLGGSGYRFSDGSLVNRGELRFEHNGPVFFSATGAGGGVLNEGVVVKSGLGSTGILASAGPLINHGSVDVQSGSLGLLGGLEQSGSMLVRSGATLLLWGESNLSPGATAQIDGVVDFGAGVHDLDPAQWTIGGTLRLSGAEVTLHAPPAGAMELLAGTVNYGYFLDKGTTFSIPVMQNFLAGYTVAPGSTLTLSHILGGAGFGASDLTFAAGSVTGQLGGAGEITFANSLLWLGGSMTGGESARTVVGPSGVLSLAMSNPKTLSRTLEVNGDTTWSGGQVNVNGGVFVNRGLLTATAGAGVVGIGAGGVFVNEGEFVSQGATGEVSMSGAGGASLLFENHGLVDVRQGTMAFLSTLENHGQIVVQPGATLRLGGTSTLEAGSSITGGGLVEFASGSHLLEKGVFATTGALRNIGATVDVGAMLGSPAWSFFGGRTNFLLDTAISGSLIDGGDVGGAGTLSIASLTWARGAMLAGGDATVSAAGSLTFAGSASQTRTLSRLLVNESDTTLSVGALTINGGVFENAGVFRGAGGAAVIGSGLGGQFVNHGQLLTQGSGAFGLDGALSIVNHGTMQIAAGSTLRIGGDLVSMGSIDGPGTLRFSGGSSVIEAGSGLTAPRIEVAGGQVIFEGATPTVVWGYTGGAAVFRGMYDGGSLLTTGGTALRFEGGLSLAPSGIIQTSGLGTIDLARHDVTTARLQQLGGGVVGDGDLTLTQQMSWTGGTMSGAGRTIVESGAVATLGFFAPITLSRELELRGTASWGSAIVRLDGGTLRNEGLLTATAFQGNTASMVGLAGGGALINEGTFVVQGGGEARLFRSGGDMALVNTGTVEVREGLLRLLGADETTNDGVYDLRHSGAVEVEGDFANAAGAALAFEVGGMKERGLSGLMTVTGEASLAGTLSVSTPEAFEAAWGDRWAIMSYGSLEGDFDAFDLPTTGFAARGDSYGASDLRWYAEAGGSEYFVGVSHIADIDHDGLIGFSDLNVIVSNFNTLGSWAMGDVDGDGFVGFADLNLVVSLFNVAAPRNVPGPGGLAVVLIAAGAGVRRRRGM